MDLFYAPAAPFALELGIPGTWPGYEAMSVQILGINHRTAPVEIREQVAFEAERLPEALREFTGLPAVDEGLIVSTCNRTELYCVASPQGLPQIRSWLGAYHSMGEGVRRCLFLLGGQAAIRHAFTVACGLDSAILGEPQILGQMKDAYRTAQATGTTGPVLNRLFQQAFAVAKQVRTDTAIGVSPISVAYAAVALARQIFARLSDHTALLVGAGDTIELAARHLHAAGLGRMIVANRSLDRARRLATPFSGFAISLEEIPAHLAEADIVVSSTASPTPLVQRDMVAAALKQRKHRPIFMVDIAVPRDIDPAVAELEDVYLYGLDDLKGVVEGSLQTRRAAAREAEQIIDTEVARFAGALRTLEAVPTIRDVRSQAEEIRDQLLEQARRMIRTGRDPHEVLEFVGTTLTNKLMHLPSARLRKAGEEGDIELLRAARELFGLDEGDQEPD